MFEKRALVVGATGVVGNNLVSKLLGEGDWEVISVSRKKMKGESRAKPVNGDVLDADAVREALRAVAPTHVFFSRGRACRPKSRAVA